MKVMSSFQPILPKSMETRNFASKASFLPNHAIFKQTYLSRVDQCVLEDNSGHRTRCRVARLIANLLDQTVDEFGLHSQHMLATIINYLCAKLAQKVANILRESPNNLSKMLLQ